jgi:dipeptidyl aminopeptidase/acylaminoacyl peptidase
MRKILLYCLLISQPAFSQTGIGPLTVEKIMRDPKWIGTSPSNPYWSADGRYLFFNWNPEKAVSDSVYYISSTDKTPRKASAAFRNAHPSRSAVIENSTGTAMAYILQGDVLYRDKSGERRVTRTVDPETSPQFLLSGVLVYTKNLNLFSWDPRSGETIQLTNFQRGSAPRPPLALSAQEKWLQQDQLKTSIVLRTRKEKREAADSAIKSLPKPEDPKAIYLDEKNLTGIVISPDGRFVSYRLVQLATGKSTIVPNYVTETGFTTDIPGRRKVGATEGSSEFFVFDRQQNKVVGVSATGLPGIADLPDYARDKPTKDSASKKLRRGVTMYGPFWNRSSTRAIVDIRSEDNKDRWLMLMDPATGNLNLLDRQRDEAWIGGPGINSLFSGSSPWLNEEEFWYHSEATGYSHLYKMNVNTKARTALTRGNYEVQSVQLSKDKKYFYLTTNEVHPGEQHFYRMPVTGGKAERITTQTGAHQVFLSPDEKQLAYLYSYSNKPWELYLQENKAEGRMEQITKLAQSEEFRSYPWRDPKIITFKAADGATVYARLYQPATPHASKPAVVFVHGAGYLQNVHKWWSSYFREYLFHNLLADQGYTVLDIDYRGSAGYGRDWRTGIYRYMGDKDLGDHVDGARYLVEQLGINPSRIGIYGGSYGGFITLMAMFTKPGVFASGAALRSVTDWAHYNHGYTSNILNEPFTDSLSFSRSSPIYYAEGLKGHLLMCHGMVDVNVHFQDIVRLTQRLIELGKDNWELAVYPVEDHGFVEPSSWTDEYKRILKLFERTLK